MTATEKKREKYLKNGGCRSCGKPRDPQSKTFCTSHLEKQRQYSGKSVKKLRTKVKIKFTRKFKPKPTEDHPFKIRNAFRMRTPEERRLYNEQMKDQQEKEYRLIYNEYEY